MDFTYFVAFFIALVSGFFGALIFVFTNGRSLRRLLGAALAVTLVADFGLLYDWTRTNELNASTMLLDLIFFTTYGMIGCMIGAAPVLASRWLYRRFGPHADS